MSDRSGPMGFVFGALLACSCAPGGFRDEQKIDNVRILASSADKPYAKPGDLVTVSVLAVDGRKREAGAPAAGAQPMQVFWLGAPGGPPFCTNPPGDAYYACLQAFRAIGAAGDAGMASGDAGKGGGLGGLLQPGVALALPTGDSFQFRMPLDAVTSHPKVQGVPIPYGLVIVFNIACAGHVEYVPIDPGDTNPVVVPFGCFDAQHNRLPPDDYVIGFTRVYAYDTVTNDNPVISGLDIVEEDGGKGDPDGSGIVERLSTCNGTSRALRCPHVSIGPMVPVTSWEPNPEVVDKDGNPVHEELWADYYMTLGAFSDPARLLYDSHGSIGDPAFTDNWYFPPSDTSDGVDGKMWIVVHDDRGGAAWRTISIHLQTDAGAK